MFTGIISQLGNIRDIAVDEATQSAVITIGVPPEFLEGVGHGDSIATNGVCLTVVDQAADHYTVDVMKESLDRTNLGHIAVGARVNLEKAMLANAGLDGHIVQGHVDCTATLISRDHQPKWDILTFEIAAEYARYIAEKGSVAIDGTSLTVTAVTDTTFSVSLIPITLEETVLGDRAIGDTVNIEVDVLAKYVERLLATSKKGL